MKRVKFTNITWKEGKYYVAQCLNVDVSSFGKNRAEALKNLEEALELYFEEDKHRIHEVKDPEIATQRLQYA